MSNIILSFETMLVSSNEIEGESTLVCLRKLHSNLGSKREFAHWAKDRLQDFTQPVDFTARQICQAVKSEGYGQGKIDYLVTLDVAKHIAMYERTEAGKAIRTYFIEVEKKWRAEQQEKLTRLSKLEAQEKRRIEAKENARYPVVKEVTYFDGEEEITKYSFISQDTPPVGFDRELTQLTSSLRNVQKAIEQVKGSCTRLEDIPEEVSLVNGDVVNVRDMVKNSWY